MKILALDSVCVWSENYKELAKFYEKILNLPVDKRLNLPDDTGVQFKIGDVYLFIGRHSEVFGKARDPYRIMIGFSVKSVNQAYEELSKKGVEFVLQPSASPDKTFYVATALDPEGNIIQFFSDNL